MMIVWSMICWCKETILILWWKEDKEAWWSTLHLQENKVVKLKDRKPCWLLAEFQ